MNTKHIYGLDYQTFFSFIDNLYDEIMIYDKNMNVVYINQACKRHYSKPPQDIIGQSFHTFVAEQWWDFSILPVVMREKRAYAVKQTTSLGRELLTIAVPILDKENEIEFVVMNVRDDISNIDLFNPDYIFTDKCTTDIIPVFKSEAMKSVISIIDKAAKLNVPCLFLGENGTGKSTMAKYLHSISSNAKGEFLTIDCNTSSPELLEDEILSILKTGYSTSYFNNINLINGSILFHHIDKLSLITQEKIKILLLSDNFKKLNIRILSSSSKDLISLININEFKSDLYNILNKVTVRIPNLSERKFDIPELIYIFKAKFCKDYNINKQFSDGVMTALQDASWGGNVDELVKMIEHLLIMTDSLIVDVDQLPKSVLGIDDSSFSDINYGNETLRKKMERYESYLILEAYQKHSSSRKMAEYLGISQSTANNLIRKYIDKA